MTIGDSHLAVAHVEDEQRAKMKQASTALVTEAKREILWLKGFGIFYVFGIYTAIQITTDNFPLAIILATATFTFIKRFIDTKPEDYLKHNFCYWFVLPKHFTYRPENTDRFDKTVRLRAEIADM